MNTTIQNTTNYKNSSLGLIPVDWEIKKIGKITKTTAGGTPSTHKLEYWNGDIKWMSSGDLNLKRIYDVKGRITEIGLKNSSTKLIPQNCILIGLAGQGKTRGTVAMNMVELCTNQSVAAILPSSEFHEEYLYHNLDYRYFELRQLSTGDGGRGGLNLNIINSVSIPLPPLPEQKAIADCLSTWDKAIEKQNALIAQKELSKKALMQQLLSGKKRMKGFSGEWKEYQYREILKVVKRSIEWNEDELYKLISVKRRSGGIFYREALLGSQIMVKNLRNVNESDFLFSKMQIVHGASALVTREFADSKISGSYIACVAKNEKEINMDFFNWLSKLPYFYHQTYISSYGVHIEKMTFDFESFLSLDIKLPNVGEQTALVNVLQCADDELQILKKKLKQLEEQKKGMMQMLLTGKKRLKI